MKKYSFLFALFLIGLTVKGQEAHTIALNLHGGYAFSDKVEYKLAYGYVEESFQYGAGLEYFFADNNSAEIKYIRQDTHLPLYIADGTQLNAGDDKGAINYIFLDGTHYFDTGSKTVYPYLGGGAGVGIVETPQSGTETKFAWNIKTGIKIKTGSTVDVNLNAYLQSVTSAVGNSYYWTYYGLVGVTDYVSTYQFGLGATIGFNFK